MNLHAFACWCNPGNGGGRASERRARETGSVPLAPASLALSLSLVSARRVAHRRRLAERSAPLDQTMPVPSAARALPLCFIPLHPPPCFPRRLSSPCHHRGGLPVPTCAIPVVPAHAASRPDSNVNACRGPPPANAAPFPPSPTNCHRGLASARPHLSTHLPPSHKKPPNLSSQG